MLRHAAATRVKLLSLASSSGASPALLHRTYAGGAEARRTLVTSTPVAHKKKRALNKVQLSGDKAAGGGAAAATAAAATGAGKKVPPAASVGAGAGAASPAAASGAPAAGTAAPASAAGGAAKAAAGGGGGGGGAGMAVLGFVVLGALGVGGAYYYDLIDFQALGGPKGEGGVKAEEKIKLVEEEEPMAAEEGSAAAKEGGESGAAAAAVDETAEEEGSAGGGGNRVTSISVPPADENRPAQAVPAPEHPPNANRVTGLPVAAAAAAAIGAREVQHALVSAEEAARELTASAESETESKLRSVHKSLRANVDDAYLADIDGLSAGELKVRVVRLAAEMEDRAKWEAVRLKEFLAMKEKETAEKYLEVLQKQRVEFEDLLARRLRDQEDAISRQANAALQAKEDTVQSVVTAAAEAQQAEHDAELKSATERIDRETKAKYEADFESSLANEKAKFAKDMEGRVAAVEAMAAKLRELEQVLEVSRSFESGSQHAHRVSAAGLAFATKAETSKGAGEELAALKAASVDESVIASALSKLPSSVKSGVPTLPELQAKFDKVHSVSRQAALVPEGRAGLGGQLFGMAFASVTIPPSPDSTPSSAPDGAPSEDDNSSEYILSRARRHVQLGDLESAVGQLENLKGQAAFVVKDWKQAAMDRIFVDKSVKVIKMECALMNKNMGGS